MFVFSLALVRMGCCVYLETTYLTFCWICFCWKCDKVYLYFEKFENWVDWKGKWYENHLPNDDCVPDMGKRQLVNLLLFGAISLPYCWHVNSFYALRMYTMHRMQGSTSMWEGGNMHLMHDIFSPMPHQVESYFQCHFVCVNFSMGEWVKT